MADGRELGWNDAIIRDFHEHAGEITLGRLAGSRLLLMTTIGAHTSEKHTVPLGYDPDGDDYIVVGSNSGLEQQPAWLANIAANPIVTVEVGTDSFQGQGGADGRARNDGACWTLASPGCRSSATTSARRPLGSWRWCGSRGSTSRGGRRPRLLKLTRPL